MASALQRLFKKRRANAKGKAQVASSSSSSSWSSFAVTPTNIGSGSIDQQPTPALTVSSLNSSDGRPASALYAHSTFASSSALDEQLGRLSLHGGGGEIGMADALGRRRARAQSVDALGGSAWTGIASHRSSSDSPAPVASPTHTDDVEIDESPIFVHLSQAPSLAKEWEEARLVVVPSPAWLAGVPEQLLQDDAYAALHAFVPSRMFQDRFVGVRDRDAAPLITSTVTIDTIAGTVHIATSVYGRLIAERTLAVLGEMSFYRTARARTRTYSSSQAPALSSSPASSSFEVTSRSQREKVRVRCLCVEGLVVPDEAMRLAAAGPEAVRQVELVGKRPSSQHRRSSTSSSRNPSPHAIAFPTTTPDVASSHATFQLHDDSAAGDATMADAHDDASVKEAIPAQRNCFVDLALILHPPPALLPLRPALEAAFSAIRHASTELTTSYVLVKGFEMYNVGRVRRGVIAKAWLAFENAPGSATLRLDAESRTRLLLLLENVAMAHCHSKLYGAVLDSSREADEEVDETLQTYASVRVGMLELDVRVPAFRHRPERLRKTVARLEGLRDAETDLDSLLYPLDVEGIVARASEVKAMWDGSGNSVTWPSLAGVGAALSTTTPLDTLETLRSTIEEVGRAAADQWQTSSSRISLQSMETSKPLGADELLPVLAYAVVKARPKSIVSLLVYARTFGLSNVTSPETSWALTTFEAVVDYLRRDPLGLTTRSLSRATSLSSASSHGRSMSPPPARGLASPRSARPALVSNATHHGSTSVSSSSSLRRARRVSLPATGYASSEPPGATRRRSIVSDEGDSTTEASPTLSQDGFKVPALPIGGATMAVPAANSRRASRSSAFGRPRSILGSLEEGDGHHASSVDGHLSSSQVMQRAGSGSGAGEQLHIRPQIVVRTRKNTASSVSTLDQAQALSRSVAKGGVAASPPSLSSSPPVRVVGRPKAVVTSSTMARTSSDHGPPAPTSTIPFTRRTSMDSWSALSLLGRGQSGDVGGGGSSWLGSLADWSSGTATHKRTGSSSTSRPASITSVDGVPPSSTFNTLPRSTSGSGFADTTVSDGSHRDTTSGVFPMSSSVGSLVEAAPAAIATVPAPPAPSSTSGSLAGKRKRTRLLSTSSPAAPQLTPASEFAPAGFVTQGEAHVGDALQAVIGSPATQGQSGAAPPAGGALGLGLFHPPSAQSPPSDSYFPPAPALRVVVPSPVEEIADPMATSSRSSDAA